MKILVIAVLVFAGICVNANLDSECRTPGGGVGICKSFTQCPELGQKLAWMRNNASEEYSARRKKVYDDFKGRALVCGGLDSDVKFCCSDCITPDGKGGLRKHIRNCQHLKKMLVNTKFPDKTYVRMSRINNSTADVCCGPDPFKSGGRCDALISSPPDPTSRCCGRDTSSGIRLAVDALMMRDHPWAVLLEYDEHRKSRPFNCGGTLISNSHVITSAQCVASNNLGEPKRVRVGEYDLKNPGIDCSPLPDDTEICTEGSESIPVDKVTVHEGYDPATGFDDIALIRLSYPVRYTDFTRPICLPTYDVIKEASRDPQYFTVAGWGKAKSSRYKREATVQIVNIQKCQDAYKYRVWSTNYRLWEKQICAGVVNGMESCYGDFGGGLITWGGSQYVLAGVGSIGPMPCGTPGLPGLYTSVYHYLEWIKYHTQQ